MQSNDAVGTNLVSLESALLATPVPVVPQNPINTGWMKLIPILLLSQNILIKFGTILCRDFNHAIDFRYY